MNTIPGDAIKMEAWLLRDMVYFFSRAAKRGHRPREPEMQVLMRAADIPIPEYVSRRSSSSVGGHGFCFRLYFFVETRYFGGCDMWV